MDPTPSEAIDEMLRRLKEKDAEIARLTICSASYDHAEFEQGYDTGVATERERCARIAESIAHYPLSLEYKISREIAAAIREGDKDE